MSHTFHVISHTHWDREWYLTFQQFRMRLVDLVDNVLALLDRDPAFRFFNLDAQTIVLEDYLAVKPQNRERLERYIREGRITVGPWYQLNDEFLTSGEATIRSLLVGTRIAERFGASMKIGYLPDQFGNLSQMPQIFRGFGIDNVIVGRGRQLVGDRKMEFLWQSPDGSEVIASLMAFWYNNAQHFPADPEAALHYTWKIHDRMAPRSAVSHLLLMNGVDHLEAQQNLSPILAAINERLPDETCIIHSTLPQYMDALKAEVAAKHLTLDKHVGELREDRGGSCLAGTLSSRMYLKQANHHAQITLEKYAEPFSAFAALIGAAYPYDFLHYAWKLLMQNHPHDSICGCSVDQVHAEMMPRFQQVEQIGEELIARALQHLADRIFPHPNPSPARGEGLTQSLPSPQRGTSERGRGAGGEGIALVVFNSLNWARTDPVIATLTFPLGVPTRGNPPRDDSKQVHGFALTDEEDKEIPFAVTNVACKMRAVLSPVELPLDQWVQEYTLEFIAHDVPACGYKTYTVTPRHSMPHYAAYDPKKLDFDVFHDNDPTLEDVGDVGDEYLHRKPLNDVRITRYTYQQKAETRQDNAVRVRKKVVESLALPAHSDAMRRSEATVDCPINVISTLWIGVPRVEYRFEVDNRAKDHRLRACWNTYGSSHLLTESAFDVIERPHPHPLEKEGALPFYPQQFWAEVVKKESEANEPGGWTIINRGLPEVELYEYQHEYESEVSTYQDVAVTLLRCVGYLSRRGDGPQFETPDAQCQGKHAFELAVFEHKGDWKTAKVWKQAYQFNTPLRAIQTEVKPDHRRDLPPSLSFITVEPDSLIVTAIKRAEDDPNTLIVRFFNTTDEPVTGGKVFVRGAKSARRVNLNEEAQQDLALAEDGSIALETVAPKQIITLAFAYPPNPLP